MRVQVFQLRLEQVELLVQIQHLEQVYQEVHQLQEQ
jgi:hypothetical protein